MKILGISVAEGWSESSSVAKYIAVNQAREQVLGFGLMGFFLGCSCVKACSVVIAGRIQLVNTLL